ncbi:MAG: hypothetical protein U9N49_10000 [Campylobacterota bacterium]|nr:hypothetical protein [Campylobacterota bacterium]
MNSLKPLILATLLTTLSLTSIYAEDNESNTSKTEKKDTTTDAAMEKIDSVEDDILSSLEAEAKKEKDK